MIHIDFHEPSGLLYVASDRNFQLNDLYDALEERYRSQPPETTLGRIAVVDLRNVPFLDLTEPEMRRFILRRRALGDPTERLPVAVLVGTLHNYGIARMYGILADVWRLRSDRSLYPSLDVDEATDWMTQQQGCTDTAALRSAMHLAGRRAEMALNV